MNMHVWAVMRRLAVAGAILAMPVIAYAQEATLTGAVTDETGGVLPGVSIAAQNSETGNKFLAVTDERGVYRIPVRIGTYAVTADLQGFGAVTKTIETQVGQVAVANLQLKPSTIQEAVTVRGEAPLVNTTQSVIGTTIDRRQMESIPLQGRNWMDLALLAPGVRSIEAGSGVPETRQGYSQINVDGQQTTFLMAATEAQQPKYSKDAIAEFELVSNRFDATQGRSAGFAVNAITKSGTNINSGTFSSFFRNDALNAQDKTQKRVIPYQNQQAGGTFGGPIMRDRLHYFVNYEYEREPNTAVFTHPLVARDVPIVRRQHVSVQRMDAQFSPSTRLSVRGQVYNERYYGSGNATSHPGSLGENQRYGSQIQNVLTHVVSNSSVMTLSGGWSTFTKGSSLPFNLWKGGCNPTTPHFGSGVDRCGGSTQVAFQGLTVGTATAGQQSYQQTASFRGEFATSYNKAGRHDVKMGGEYIRVPVTLRWCTGCQGTLTLQTNTPPPANFNEMFPVWNDASTWNYASLSPLVVRANQNVSNSNFIYHPNGNLGAGWLQDDWRVASRLTLNLGLRWDIQTGAYSEKLEWEPWKLANLPYDKNNFAPRTGFAFVVNDATSIRGGYGIFFTQEAADEAHQTLSNLFIVATETQNDGRTDFATNWFNGPNPTYDQAQARMCNVNGNAPGCLRRGSASGEINSQWGQQMPFSHQASAGMQRQIGSTIGISADVTYTGGRNEEHDYNINRTFNRVTGDANNFNTIALRAFPDFGSVTLNVRDNWTNLYTLQTEIKKRMSDRWQASGTYSYFRIYTGIAAPDQFSFANGVASAADLTRTPVDYLRFDVGRQYYRTGDPHHRLVGNAIWDAGKGFTVSGVYLTTDGGYLTTSCGCAGATGLSNRQRLNGTIIPINNFNKKAISRLDLRLQKRISIGGHRTLDGTVEAFNVLNHANFSTYTTDESNPLFGNPTFNSNQAYQPFTMQLGFRLAF